MGLGEFTLRDEGSDTDGQCIDTLIRVPEMLLSLDSSADRIKGKLVHPPTLWGNGAIINEELESLPVFALEHHFKLLPASAAVISFFGINVEGLQLIFSPGIEDCSVL